MILKPQQLRKGNLVFNRDGALVPVKISDLQGLELWHATKSDKNPPIKPILLKAEHMLAFKFIETMGEYYFNDFEIKLFYNKIQKVWIVLFHDFNTGEFIHLTTVKYVHQLQNVYYTLFTSELKYEH